MNTSSESQIVVITLGQVGGKDLNVLSIPRCQVETQNYSQLMDMLGSENLPGGAGLARMMGSVTFTFGGYESDPREIYEIQEVRDFCLGLNEVWPYLLYFASLDDPTLSAIAWCFLPNLLASKRPDQPGIVWVASKKSDVKSFLKAGIEHMVGLCRRADLPEWKICARVQAVREYFTASNLSSLYSTFSEE